MRRFRTPVLVCLFTLAGCGGAAMQPASLAVQAQGVRVAALQSDNGSQFVEFTPSCGNPFLGQLASGPDGNVWFTRRQSCSKRDPRRGTVGFVDIATNAVTEYLIPARNAHPVALAQNDGYVWVADTNLFTGTGPRPDLRLVYRVDPAGNFASFPTPGTDMYVSQMTLGPDGNLWMAGENGRDIGHPGIGVMTAQGTTTIYPFKLPKYKAARPTSIVAGPDKNLWATTLDLGAIVRVSPADGNLTFFQVGGKPQWMTSADHVLIYTDQSGTQISVMDVNGNAKIYPTPPGVAAGFVASKSDGTVLFNDVKTNAIGTFDPATGAFGAEVQPPDVASAGFMTNAPDGNVWFDDGSGHIGAYLKYVMSASPTALSWSGSQCSSQTLSVAEPLYRGSFSATAANPQVAVVTVLSGSTFAVTPAAAGTTTIAVSDGQHNAVNVPVSVQNSCP